MRPTRASTPARARVSRWKPRISASAPQRKTSGKPPPPSWRNARRNSPDAEIANSKPNRTQEPPMTSENIFSGLKVVDFSSFVAAPGAAVILSDFAADVIKGEPTDGPPGDQC